MASRTTIILTLLILTVSPTALAGWGAFGEHYPNTQLDVTGGRMWPDPDTSSSASVNKVYFGSFISSYPGTTVNPNVPEARTATNAPIYAYWALLGVWKDCNQDGYVGLSDQGLFEYRTSLLLDQSVCPATPTPNPIPLNWFPSHNDGQWVREFLPIQWFDTQSQDYSPANPTNPDHNPYNVNDNGARVWIDEGLASANAAGGGGCWINPQPVGTYRSTGGVVKFADCYAGYRVTDNFDSIADNTTQLNAYSFSDDNRDQYNSHSKANVQNPWGSESDGSYAQAWDCSKAPLVQETVSDPTNGAVFSGNRYFNVSAPKVPPSVSPTLPSINPSGSAPLYTLNGASASGTANATGSGFDQCNRNTIDNGASKSGVATASGQVQSSHRGDTLAHLPYVAEGDTINQPVKTSTYVMQPIELSRTNNTFSGTLGPGTPGTLGSEAGGYLALQAGFDGTPFGHPELSTNGVGTGGDGLWFTTPNVIAGPIDTYMTAYAFVSDAAVSAYGLWLPGGTPGVSPAPATYGQEACQGATTGFVNGWDCDATHWYLDAKGHDVEPRDSYLGADPSSNTPCTPNDGFSTTSGCMPVSARVGAPYNLRSVTCYDQSAENVHAAAQARNLAHQQSPLVAAVAVCDFAS